MNFLQGFAASQDGGFRQNEEVATPGRRASGSQSVVTLNSYS